jgi:signal transduction histidine kinase/GAF domain-containing protein
MNIFQIVTLIGLGGNTILGVFVLLSNPKRAVNKAFFALTLFMMFWLGAMFVTSWSWPDNILIFWIRQTLAFAALIPIGVFALHLTIIDPDIKIWRFLYKLRYWLLASLAIVVVCHSPVFVISATTPTEKTQVPPIEYGWGFFLHISYFIVVVIFVMINFWRTAKKRTGVQKAEIQFLQMGCAASFVLGVVVVTIAKLVANQELSRFVPLSVLVLDGFVTYGIATRRILAVSAVLQRVVSYALMTVYLISLYIFSVWLIGVSFRWMIPDTDYLAHLLAAVILAFSIAPAHGWMQAVSHRLFASANLLNVNVVLERAAHMFQEVSTEDNLMEKFSELIATSFGTTKVLLLKPDNRGGYSQFYPNVLSSDSVVLQPENSVIQLLHQDHEAFTVDTLQRMRPGPVVTDALTQLKELNIALAIGSFMRKEMKAILLLSQKKSGRIYDLRDQRALQLLCDQFAVALENASLYTTVQNGKIYNEILLDSLTSGIIAVNADRVVTVFNQCAQVQIGLSESAVIDKEMDVLPPALVECLELVLKTQSGFRDKDVCIKSGDEDIPIRVSGAIFHGYTGNLLGALLAFNDMTLLKKMEEQIRRTDRLSSIGTLSAGMAHEIKNPLVTIKTFTQLLPQQYSDTEFRHTFFDLVGQEVKRIDTIVNRLLNFARPAKATLKPVSLHDVIENSLRLAEQQLAQHGIALERHLDAARHVIEADAEQLNQTFVNFFLNAVHAMKKGGRLTVRTAIVKFSPDIPQAGSLPNVDRIQVDVQDTGCGIAPEDISKIFDPFFTTKEDGVGLGLSVSHGIIQEHNGTIDVESEKGKGTVFHVQFPLLAPQEKKDE